MAPSILIMTREERKLNPTALQTLTRARNVWKWRLTGMNGMFRIKNSELTDSERILMEEIRERIRELKDGFEENSKKFGIKPGRKKNHGF